MSDFWLASESGPRGVVLDSAERQAFRANAVEITMYYVGAGEAIVISQGGNAILVDGGAGSAGANADALAKKLADEIAGVNLHAIVASHPHEDHTNFHGVLSAKSGLFVANARYFDNATPAADTNWETIRDLKTRLPFRRVPVTDRSRRDRNRIPSFSLDAAAYLLRARTKAKSKERQKYWSVFMFLRYREAWMLFTGDVSKSYEKLLLPDLQELSPRAHLLKVTHHGSSGGTSEKLVSDLRPGISIVSTTDHDSHWLEDDVEKTLSTSKIYATYDRHDQLFRDIIVRTDGEVWRAGDNEGVLFEVETRAPVLIPDPV